MLFNSYAFIGVFLPITLGLFLALGAWRPRWAAAHLAAASLVFYSNLSSLPLLLASILANFLVSRGICGLGRGRAANVVLATAIAANLSLLAWFKYKAFLLAVIAGTTAPVVASTIPLGISFFTFTQIAFLVDAAKGEVRNHTPVNYLLFVTFFPHLIAGPILHHRDMMGQFARRETYALDWSKLAQGLALFAIGLAKKALLADAVAEYADAAFQAGRPTLIEAWSGVLSYTFQIYFDFSGYCDMALGLGLMFGIRMPINFNSPYRATSIIEFWRRWHISLSVFLRDYLYIPLGGGRRGPARRWLNLLVTMLLGGLWHGAAWTFVIWGGLHGIFLVINHAWRTAALRWDIRAGRWGRFAGWMLTFVAVAVAWVFFRAPDGGTALAVLAGMAGLNGVVLPAAMGNVPLLGKLASLGIQFGPLNFGGLDQLALLAVLAAIALMAPNSQCIVLGESSGEVPDRLGRLLRLRPSLTMAAGYGVLLMAAIATFHQKSPFLYFQF
jgi:alginate O-acetyltransferase complex protein AlgI